MSKLEEVVSASGHSATSSNSVTRGPTRPAPPTPSATTDTQTSIDKHRKCIKKSQETWKRIKDELPPQLTGRHIGMMSLGGVIGTGFFLGSADALSHGGPAGALLGYTLIGSVVYCLCVSIGEMIAFLPNVGGVVGIANLYVDPALGFSLGWSAWYNWSITLPAEITAATVLVGFWTDQVPVNALIGGFLAFATLINCLPSRLYGEIEFYLSILKVCAIIFIIVMCVLLDAGIGQQGVIGFKYWNDPAPFAQYLQIPGIKGRFLGFWSVLMQASFAFFGSEVPGIAAGEVIDATRNVPRALHRVWIRIALFYIIGIFCAGLVVQSSDVGLLNASQGQAKSPFVIAAQNSKITALPSIVNGAILISALSAAASDIFISSRFLYFLAQCDNAPSFLASVFPKKRPSLPSQALVPLASVLVSASIGFLGYLSSTKSNSAETAFEWIVAVASVAALQSWVCILFTYLRWYQGTVAAEKRSRSPREEKTMETLQRIEQIKKHRHIGQPYLALYAFFVCIVVILTNGLSVFIHNEWRIADVPGEVPSSLPKVSQPIATFLSAYIPIPVFILLTLGYKLIHQTRMVSLDAMDFSLGTADHHYDEPIRSSGPWWIRFKRWLMLS